MRDEGGMAREDRAGPAGHVGLAFEVIQRLAFLRRAGAGKLQQSMIDRLGRRRLHGGQRCGAGHP